MTAPIDVVFLGSDIIALPLLDWLAGEGSAFARVKAVFTQPDRAVGRGQKVTSNGIKTWALARGLPVYQPEKITEEVRAQLAALAADVSLVMAYGHILKQDFIDTPRLGTLNLHASLLPHYRGASPIQTAIANGDAETGVSLMRIVRQLDAGPVADVERVAIGPHDTALEIEHKLAAACRPLLARTLPFLASKELAFVEQDHGAASFCRRLVKEDGQLDFTAPAAVLAARINGLFPWPACTVEIGGQLVKIGLAVVAGEAEAAALSGAQVAGTVLAANGHGLWVATGRGVLRCLLLQKPGGKMMAAAEFLRGFSIPVGTVLPSAPLAPLVGPVPFPFKR
jgi:methionyl-tRNA formyltransferase